MKRKSKQFNKISYNQKNVCPQKPTLSQKRDCSGEEKKEAWNKENLVWEVFAFWNVNWANKIYNNIMWSDHVESESVVSFRQELSIFTNRFQKPYWRYIKPLSRWFVQHCAFRKILSGKSHNCGFLCIFEQYWDVRACN